MPGFLTGAVQGFDAGQRAQATALQLSIEKQRADREDAQLEYERNRQQHLDALPIISQQLDGIAAQLRSPEAQGYEAYLKATQTPPDPKTDPEAAKKFDEADSYFKNLHEKAQPLFDARDQHVQALTGIIANNARAKAQQNTQAVLSGAVSIHDLPAGDVANMLSFKSGLTPDMFRADPQTGQMGIGKTLDDAHDALTTGDWTGKGHVITALYPQTQAIIGKTVPGLGTISGVTINGATPDPKDPDKYHLNEMLQVHDKDGNVKYVTPPPDAPGLVVSRAEGAKRLVMLQGLEGIAKNPDIQSKIGRAMDQRGTWMHQINDDLLSHGVSPNELLPAPYKWERAGPISFAVDGAGRPVQGPDGKPLTMGQQRSPAKLQEIQARMDATGEDFDTAEQAVDLGNKGLSDFRNPNVRPAPADGGAATSALNDSRRQKSADVAHRGAMIQLAHEKGYVVDQQGNVKYGRNDPDGKFAKGDAVTDPEFDEAVSTMRQAADEAVQNGKTMRASELVKLAKDKAEVDASTPKPMPKSKDALVVGKTYQTARGVAKWDGSQFTLVKK